VNVSRQSLVILALFLVLGCGERDRPDPVPIEIPDYFVCIQDYSGDVEIMGAAIDRGDPDAILCGLGFEWGRGIESAEVSLLYRYYRATGEEPVGLDERIRRRARNDLAIRLEIAHADSPELTPFPFDSRGCPIYDEIATELLLRVEPGDDMRCMPRRGWWR
jgi:hypothetical protein